MCVCIYIYIYIYTHMHIDINILPHNIFIYMEAMKAFWTNLDQELSFSLKTNLKGPIRQQIILFFFLEKLYMRFFLIGLAY